MSTNTDPETAFSEEMKRELREAFEVFLVDEADDAIPASSLGVIARSMYLNPTEAELSAATSRFGGEGGRVTFEQFLECFAAWVNTRLSSQDVIEAFQVFDTDNTGYIHAAELKRLLTTLGEKMSEEEADELLGDADVDDGGRINYRKFAERIMT
jgi:calmodulin